MAPPADIMRERQMRHGKHEARTGTSNTAAATRLQNRSYLTWLLSKIGAIAVKFGGVYAALCLMGMGDRTYTGEINIVFAALLLCAVIASERLNELFKRSAKRASKTYNACDRYLRNKASTCPRTGA